MISLRQKLRNFRDGVIPQAPSKQLFRTRTPILSRSNSDEEWLAERIE